MLKDKSLELKSDGVFTYHGDTFSTGLMDPEYHAISQKGMNPEKGYPQTAAGKWMIKGEVGAASGSPAFDLSETLGADGDDALRADFHVQKSDQKPYKVIQLEISVPAATAAGRTLTTDGAALTLPKDPARNTLLYKSGVKKLVLPAHDGSLVVEGNFTVELQDERQWQGDSFQARLVILDSHATANAGDLSVSLRAEPFRSTPISLAAQANRGFRDEVADDHKGGWTDQGPENDMSPLPVGPLAASAVPFRIVDPAANGGKSCLVLSQAKEELFHTVDLPVPGNPMLANLYLLHGAAWVPKSNEKVGVIRARYADGTSQEFDVRCQRDVGDWWSGASLPNAVLGWTGRNQSADVGLFVSKFPLDRSKGLASVQLESTDPALWMVVALTGSPDDIPLASDVPLTIHAGPDWASYPLKYQIEPGSVFDFASLNDAPAGKYGPLIATPGGHFEFAGRPGMPARFWGVNLTFGANFLDKEAADALADQLARSGYNTVRFHHFDGVLTAAGRSYDIDPAPLDKLDYLFAAMKKRGLYLNIDLFTIRKFMKDGLPDYVKEATNIKTIFPINDAAIDSWEKYTRNLLTHRNPYTGLTWGEDPALIGICPVNEDPLYTTMEKASDDIKKIYRDKFMQWADANHVPLPDNAARNQAYNHFLSQLQIENDAHMASFVRSLKVNTLLTGVNCGTTEAQAYPRERYDYVDNHTYLDHPTFLEKSWQLPTSLRQADPLVARGGVIRDLMSDRIFGKPYTVTELHFCWPNRYRSTEGVLTAGYASLQDWDAVYNFDYAGATTDVSAPRGANFFPPRYRPHRTPRRPRGGGDLPPG